MSYYDSRQQGGGGWNTSNGGSTSVGGGVGGYYGSAPLGGGGVGSGWYNAPAAAAPAANPYGGGYSGSYYGGGGGGGGGSTSYGSTSLGSSLKQVDFSAVDLVPFEKDFYIEHPDVSKRPESEAAQWRASKQIVVVGQGVPKPVLTFEEASMPQYILSEVLKQGFERPTPIQSQGWPMALKGKNMVGISATGSGKTLAFLLPAMIHINAQASIYFT
jgi:ATP-dependent RNA helicase DDX5/DBP2